MFRTVPLSLIGGYSLYTQQWYMSYRFVDSFRAVTGWNCSSILVLLSVQWINSWWWTEELSETCRVSCQNKSVKLVYLVGFILKKFVTMHGHKNVKFVNITFPLLRYRSILEHLNSIFRTPSTAAVQSNCQMSTKISQKISFKHVWYLYCGFFISPVIRTYLKVLPRHNFSK
jgi:hypothetical protein